MNTVLTVATGTLISEEMKSAFTTAVSQIASDVGSMIATALPYGLGIMGTFLVISLGVKFFKSIAH